MDAIKYYIKTDVGVVREHNEDAVNRVVVPCDGGNDALVLVIADGMGGENAGEVASQAIAQRFESDLADLIDDGRIGPAMQTVVRQVNEELVAMAKEDPAQYGGMGTTVVAAAFRPDGMVEVVHVGDSRLYLLDDNGLRRVTRDHSRVQLYVDAGVMSAEQADRHPDSNVLLRAVGRSGTEADLLEDEELSWIGRTFLLCSDGLTAMVPDEVIELAMKSLEPEEATHALIQECIRLGASDNVSIGVVRSGEPLAPMTEDEFREQSRELVRAWKGRAEEEERKKRLAAEVAFEASSAKSKNPPYASENAPDSAEEGGIYRLMRKAIPILILLVLALGIALGVLLRPQTDSADDDTPANGRSDEEPNDEAESVQEHETSPEAALPPDPGNIGSFDEGVVLPGQEPIDPEQADPESIGGGLEEPIAPGDELDVDAAPSQSPSDVLIPGEKQDAPSTLESDQQAPLPTPGIRQSASTDGVTGNATGGDKPSTVELPQSSGNGGTAAIPPVSGADGTTGVPKDERAD